MMVTIGVDLGGTNIVAGVVDEQYNILVKTKCKTQAERPAEAILETIAALCK
ncbi:MAG: ROK family protein, partial [Kiritimatiellae bacterium]|nr:ROK family protein [Kiritimatiellia bacterium]